MQPYNAILSILSSGYSLVRADGWHGIIIELYSSGRRHGRELGLEQYRLTAGEEKKVVVVSIVSIFDQSVIDPLLQYPRTG